ncbi:MAG: hypothetical protein WD025_07020 [Bacteriovoracaceae bacterium]
MKNIILSIFCLTIAGCRYQTELEKVYSLEGDKTYIESGVNGPLTVEEQNAIKKYFSGIKELGYRLKTDNRFNNYFHKKYFVYYQTGTCSNVILPKVAYEKVLERCEVNGFFICSEEARDYIQMLKSIEAELTDLERRSLEDEAGCGDALRELGVINESN